MRAHRLSPSLLGAALALGVGIAACSKDATSPGASGPTAISGSLAATDGRTGLITLAGPAASVVGAPAAAVVPAASLVTATVTLTGTVTLSDGTTATLNNGMWDTSTGALSVSGGGFTFSGTMVSGHLSGGTFTGPSITGVFSLQLQTTSTGTSVYCGTYTGRTPEAFPSGGTGTGPDNGTWNLVVGASTVDVVVLSSAGDPLALDGTRLGNTITLNVPGGTATGTLKGAAGEFVDGNYNVSGSGSGTFQGSQAACTATSESTPPIASITINQPAIVQGSAVQRFVSDSTLVFATARDAAGNIVAAPLLTWSYTGPVRSNSASTPRGQKWLVPTATGSASVQVTSQNAPGVSVTAILIIK